MTRRFRLILVGCGQIAAQAHLPAVLASRDVELCGVVDPAVERTRAVLRGYGVAVPVHESVDAALGQVDGAIVATPDGTHAAIASRCIEAGVPVLVEKPITSSLEEARALAALAASRGVVVIVGYVTRFRRNVQLLKRLVDREFFGTIHRFAYQAGSRGGWSPLEGYGAGQRRAGQGVLAVTGSHFLDRMLWIWGYPASVSALDDGAGGPEANAHVEVRFANGTRGSILCSKTAVLPGALVLDTARGRVLFRDDSVSDILLRPSDQPGMEYALRERSPLPRRAGDELFVRQLQDFVGACRGAVPLGCTLDEGMRSIRLLEEIAAVRRPLPSTWYARPAEAVST